MPLSCSSGSRCVTNGRGGRIISGVQAPNADIAIPAVGADTVSLRRWFAVFAVYMAVLAIASAYMLDQLGRPWAELFARPQDFTEDWHQALKLLIFTGYLSVCCTFLPLPTGWLVAAIATREFALTEELWSTALLVAAAGAVGSMMANLNDYHLFTLMLRHRRVAAVRGTRLYRSGARWFTRAPFTFLVVFNIIPIPVDVVRMVATTARYGRVAFAAANLLGRFVRYGLLAGLAFATDISATAAAVIMLAVAVGLGVLRLVAAGLKGGRGDG